MRRYGIYALVTSIALLLFTTWRAPSLLNWWSSSPVPNLLTCTPAIEWATKGVIEMQLWSIAIGLVVGLGLGFATRKRTTAQTTLPVAAGAPAPVVADKK